MERDALTDPIEARVPETSGSQVSQDKKMNEEAEAIPHPFGGASAEDFVFSLLEEVSHLEEQERERQNIQPEKLGFDRVYSLLNDALVSIESGGAAVTPAILEAPKRLIPNLRETSEVLDGLDAMFGESCALESLKDEVFKALELSAGTPILQTKEVAMDRFVLKLCCNTIVNMLQTGRYHVGKGILGSEGQELVELFHRINGLRTQKAYSTPEETERDATFIQYCARELG